MRKVKALFAPITILLIISITLCSCGLFDFLVNGYEPPISLESIPEFSGKAYVAINGNIPFFTESEKVTESYERYEPLDGLGRCTVTMACIGPDIMPTEKREDNLDTEPSGWQSVTYDIVPGRYLYNRCHLIGFQLTGEGDNELNLITGTRYLNIDGMLKFENMVAAYVKETGNHVMYRATPMFKGTELVARGVLLEAWSVEDEGDGICFNVYAYNNQPGIVINYANGDSALDDGSGLPPSSGGGDNDGGDGYEGELDGTGDELYVVNRSTKKYHKPSCRYATGSNTENYIGTKEELHEDGYEACKTCKP